jgi:hypothetical protein
LLAALIFGALGWWAWRRYRNRPPIQVDPYAKAQRDFAQIEKERLIEAGRPTEYVARIVDVLREYLAARVPGVRRSDTTSELLRSMRPAEGVEAELPALLERSDLVKFAQAPISVEEARTSGANSRAIVDQVETRLNPESELAKRTAVGRGKAA